MTPSHEAAGAVRSATTPRPLAVWLRSTTAALALLAGAAPTSHGQHRAGPTGFLPDGPAPTPGSLTAGPGQAVDVPVLIHEVLPKGAQGHDRGPTVATFGLPFGRHTALGTVAGRPALAVPGALAYQFRELDAWPATGAVRWALCDVLVELEADAVAELRVVDGVGRSPGHPDLLADLSSAGQPRIEVDTGPLRATIALQGYDVLSSLSVEGAALIALGHGGGLVGSDLDGQPLRPGPDTQVTIEENGPVRGVVRADGVLIDGDGRPVLPFTLRSTFRRERSDVQLDLTVRNASAALWRHARIGSLEVQLPTTLSDGGMVHAAHHLGQTYGALDTGSTAVLHMGVTDAQVDGVSIYDDYRPHLPKVAPGTTDYVHEGYALLRDEQVVHAFGDRHEYPDHGWLSYAGGQGSVTAAIRQMNRFWPAALEVTGDGLLTLGLFTGRNPAPYTFLFQQHESRTALVDFRRGVPVEPSAVARDLDHPVSGRAADYAHYDRARVLPYRLVTLEEQALAYALMGIDHEPVQKQEDLLVTRYLYKGSTGPNNNHALVEKWLGGDWLRSGSGGQYLSGLDMALYKSEWQVRRSDDFVTTADQPAPENDELPHTINNFSDDAHRYREGMVLAWYLTGDPRFRDALIDEAEVLATVDLWPHERSMYQTLRALAAIYESTRSPALLEQLRARLDYVIEPLVDVEVDEDGFGWEDLPGQGQRRYFVNSGDNHSEKPPGENFQARGFVSASLGPLAYYHAGRVLPADDPRVGDCYARLVDLAFWTRQELFPFFAHPVDRHLVYSYAVGLQQVVSYENYDFHPILFGMAHAFEQTGDGGFMLKGIEQLQAFAAHDNGPFDDNLYLLDSRLDCQHFMAVFLDWALATGVAWANGAQDG